MRQARLDRQHEHDRERRATEQREGRQPRIKRLFEHSYQQLATEQHEGRQPRIERQFEHSYMHRTNAAFVQLASAGLAQACP